MDTFWPRRADGRLAEKLPPEACIFRVNQLLDDRGLSQPELAHRSRFELLEPMQHQYFARQAGKRACDYLPAS